MISRPTPVQVSGLTSVTAVAAGSSHTVALLSDGTVKAWGSNATGAIGDGTPGPALAPVKALLP
jgi:alpha-tubulin suppressor-like RCC1 family protein